MRKLSEIAILRDTVEKLVPLLAERGLRVTQEGTQAFIQYNLDTGVPERVNIPFLPDDASDDLIVAIHGFIDHEVAHALFTDNMHKRAERQADVNLHTAVGVIEDSRIEKLMGEKFPGSVINLEKTRGFWLEKIMAKHVAEAKGDAKAEFNALVVIITRALAGQKSPRAWLDARKVWDRPDTKEMLKRLPADFEARMQKMRTQDESFELGKLLLGAAKAPPPPPPPPAPPSAPSEESEPGESESSEKADDPTGEGAETEKPEDEEDKGSEGAPAAAEAEPAEEPAEQEEGEPDEADASDEPEAADKPSEPEAEEDEAADVESAGDPEGAGVGEESNDDATDGDKASDAGVPEADETDEEEAADDVVDTSDDEPAPEDEGVEDEPVEAEEPEEPAEPEEAETTEGDPAEAEPEETGGGGSGSTVVDSPPVAGDFELTGKDDLSSAVAEHLADEAIRQTKRAEYRVFSRDYDEIKTYEFDKPTKPEEIAAAKEEFEKFDSSTRHMIAPMQAKLERMIAARNIVLKVPGYRSGRLNQAGLHRLAVNDDRVFRRKFEHKTKSTAVTLLVDNSVSMSGRDKIKVAMKSAYALGQTLERVNVPSEILGFTTIDYPYDVTLKIVEEEKRIGRKYTHYHPLYMPIYKAFKERMTPEVKQRLAHACENARDFMDQNTDGDAIEAAMWRLLKRPEPRKILMVLSDGNPAANCSARGAAELPAHVHMAIDKATRSGVEVLGIGILSEAVRTFYPKHVILKDLNDLPGTIMKEMQTILMK